MGAPEVEAFLSDLAVRRDVSASTQNQALSAILFLYKQVLQIELPWLEGVIRAKHAFAGERPGHSHGAGTARPCRCNHADLHPCLNRGGLAMLSPLDRP